MTKDDRWSPVYDAEELKDNIRQLVRQKRLYTSFYTLDNRGGLFQGDILRLNAEMPLIDEQGTVIAEGPYEFWIFMGNTCDTYRDDVIYSQIAPLHDMQDLQSHELTELEQYSLYRRFYVPAWSGSPQHAWVMDFTEMCCSELAYLRNATRVARMHRYAWFLLHSCLVRYLARDDGRDDA